MEDVHICGGIPTIMQEIASITPLNTGCKTVTGVLQDNLKGAPKPDGNIIRSKEEPFSKDGGLTVLFGNIARSGAVIKTAGGQRRHEGYSADRAVIFESQEDALDGILGGKVKDGDVVVIRYEGPKGGPGMQEMLSPTAAITGSQYQSRSHYRWSVQWRYPRLMHRTYLTGSSCPVAK